ncbi:Mitochondrial carrier domain-containing protein [Cynara cardunculus var. scolymus]|uniref:Mitochondrial carrier domain-containing protein n=1 Tax=Cynara cardunculus var. scolymus TaxID=59895 RepID=A0A118K0C0_CYNCS|nr:Mitochondrial carrier domain-containing protein [Cynara cardunculus var. scolymus]
MDPLLPDKFCSVDLKRLVRRQSSENTATITTAAAATTMFWLIFSEPSAALLESMLIVPKYSTKARLAFKLGHDNLVEVILKYGLWEVKLQKHNTEANGFKYKSGLHCTTRILKTEGSVTHLGLGLLKFGLEAWSTCKFLSDSYRLPLTSRPQETDHKSQFTDVRISADRHRLPSPLDPYALYVYKCSIAYLKVKPHVGQFSTVRGLYRGATPSFLGMAFESSILFGIYSQTKQALQGGDCNGKPEPHIIIPSAAFAGSIISFILCPSELVKVTGLFRGGGTTLLRESIGNAVFFSTYEYLRHSMHLQLKGSSFDHTMIDVGVGIVSGGLSGIAFWSAVLPLDVAKTIIQTTPDNNLTKNPFKMLKSIYRRSGLRGCYTGLGPTASRAFPANAAAIVTFEAAAKVLGIIRD